MTRQRSSLLFLCLTLGLTGCAAPLPVPVPPAAPANPFSTTTAGDTTVVAFTPPAAKDCCRRQTLPEFLGITQCCDTAQTQCGRELAFLGFLFPGLGAALQPGPPLLPITDPANFASDNEAIQTAAEIKSAEDAAPQKIAALRYLATIGCAGCYPGVEEALLEGMDDCTEAVRYEAVLAVRSTTTCPCEHCSCTNGSCCSEKIQKKLREMAYEYEDDGNPKECSERVRRQARLALTQCGPPPAEPAPPQEAAPQEGPQEGPEGPVEGSGEAPAEGNGQPGEPPADGEEESDAVAKPKPTVPVARARSEKSAANTRKVISAPVVKQAVESAESFLWADVAINTQPAPAPMQQRQATPSAITPASSAAPGGASIGSPPEIKFGSPRQARAALNGPHLASPAPR